MVALSIKTNFPDVQRSLTGLQKSIGQPALARALNRTVQAARTDMSREIRAEFRVTAQEVGQQLKLRNASARSKREITAALFAAGTRSRSLNLIRFVERAVSFAQYRKRLKAGEGGKQTLRNGGQVTKALQLRFRIKRTGPPVVIPGAFIANRGRTVFIREGESRLPIRGVQTIDIAQMFNTRRINDKVVSGIGLTLPRLLDREIAFYTNRYNAGRSGAAVPSGSSL